MLGDIADLADALCDPRPHVEPRFAWDAQRHRKPLEPHRTVQRSLLDQLADAAQPSPAPDASHSVPGSRSPGNDAAISALAMIHVGAVKLCWTLRIDPRGDVPSTIRAIVGACGAASAGHRSTVLRELRTWRRTAAIVTGWERAPISLAAPCPALDCGKRDTLQASVDDAGRGACAWCTSCREQWSEADDTIGLLARHVIAHGQAVRAAADAARARARRDRDKRSAAMLDAKTAA